MQEKRGSTLSGSIPIILPVKIQNLHFFPTKINKLHLSWIFICALFVSDLFFVCNGFVLCLNRICALSVFDWQYYFLVEQIIDFLINS